MLFALTREISPAFERCQLSHQPRRPIDLDRARAQHAAYEWALVELGGTVRRIDSGPDMPDAVFIEDTAVVLGDGAIMTRPGADARRAETPGVADALARYGVPLRDLLAPATLDGGDVLVIGRSVFVGESSRTNAAAIAQLRRILQPLGYAVRKVPVEKCLHLKSAATAVSGSTLLVNPEWVPDGTFLALTTIEVDPDEPQAGNALLVGETAIYPAAFPKTRARLERAGIRVRTVEVDEIAKAEGGVTCCCLLWER